MDRVLAGAEKRSRTLVKEEREIVAYHEAGHALVGWLLKHTDALLKVTIIPRTSAALGFAQYSPKDKKLFSKEELFDRMCMMLGGRVAESIKFGRITTGAEDDLKKVTRSAYNQVKIYGMSSAVGTLSFPADDDFKIKPFSKKLAHLMDQEASNLVGQAYRSTETLLRKNADKLELLAQELLKREVLNYDDVKNLIGTPPHGDKYVVDLVDNILPKEEK
ncbi:peptidase family M41 [Oesophagostomum dentatum]|uniref:Peptidase family M41 n=1 Tax=Oesophagostomum dentatum TaxID=61180 RepID=A0A0B1S216_OESDE|nr:peptidase family M41 [Oesophagostomum dentatum]